MYDNMFKVSTEKQQAVKNLESHQFFLGVTTMPVLFKIVLLLLMEFTRFSQTFSLSATIKFPSYTHAQYKY